jgi:XTP/dITP diphosphohydrolase
MVTLLDGLQIELKMLADFPNAAIANETGSTFVENARQKALHYAALSGLPTVAEDSGFEVDALDGAPGVHSARYLGEAATYPERFAEMYKAMRQRGRDDSTVRFVCALTLASANKILFDTTGVVEGQLAREPAGDEGFGYDPIFFYPPYGRTLGQVSTAEKSAISHRGKAFAALRDFLAQRRGAENTENLFRTF